MGIRAKLILSTCIPLLILYAIVLGWDYWASRQAALETIEQLVAQRASADAAQLDGRVLAIQAIADRAAYSLAGRVMNESNRSNPAATRTAETTPPPFESGIPAGTRPFANPNDRGGPSFGGGPFGPGGPPGDATPGEPPPGVARGAGFDPNRGFGERSFGRGLYEGLNQSPWVNAIWFRFDPAAVRTGRTPEAFGLRRVSVEGRPFANFVPPAAKNAVWFERPMREGHATWLEPQDTNDPTIGPACVFATPFYATGESTPSGVVCISVPTAALRLLREDTPVQSQLRQILTANAASRPAGIGVDGAVAEPPSLAAGGYLLLDRKGRILSRPDGQRQGATLAVGPDDAELRAAIDRTMKGRGAIVVAGGLNRALGEMAPNARYVLAMQQLPSTGWLFVTAQSEASLLGPVQSRLLKRGLFLAGSLGVLVGVMTLVLTRFCRPIELMARTVQQMGGGDLDITPICVAAKDEIGQLAKGFNDMTGALRHHIRELTEQSAEREKVDSELRIARQIQSDLLPTDFPPFPERQEFSLHAVNIPARHIAGDFFDYFFVGEDRLTVVIADVSGKGVPAALMMAVTRTMVRNLAESGLPPAAIAERVNRMLLEDTKPGLFVTMFLGQYEPATGTLVYVNAGHPPAVCLCGGRATMCCDPTGPLLGVAPAGELGPYEQATHTLEPGASILLYTDGVTEAHDQTNVMYGEARLLDSARVFAGRDTPDLCEGVVAAVMAYQHQSAADDLTLVALKRR